MWTSSAPGAASAFPEVEAWCAALRRASFGGTLVLGTLGALQVLAWAAYALDALPLHDVPNATWMSPVQTARADEPWTTDDVELLVMVRGEVGSPDMASPGSGLWRVHMVRAVEASRARRTEPVSGLSERLRRGGGVELRRENDGFVVRPGAEPVAARDALVSAMRAELARAFPDELPADTRANARAAALLVRAALGGPMHAECVWGERQSSFIPRAQLRGYAASTQQAQAAVIAGALAAAALAAVLAWSQLRSTASITKARSE